MKKNNYKEYGLWIGITLFLITLTGAAISSHYEHLVHPGCEFVGEMGLIKQDSYLLIKCDYIASLEVKENHATSQK